MIISTSPGGVKRRSSKRPSNFLKGIHQGKGTPEVRFSDTEPRVSGLWRRVGKRSWRVSVVWLREHARPSVWVLSDSFTIP